MKSTDNSKAALAEYLSFSGWLPSVNLPPDLNTSEMADQKLLSTQQIAAHNSPEDCWIVVDNQVWDVTEFLDEHPGGSAGALDIN